MTREDRLEFCKICHNRKNDFQKGLLCGITNKHAVFKTTCESFVEDFEEKAYLLLRDLDASGHHNASKSLNSTKNKENGALMFIIGVLILFISISYLSTSGFLLIPLGSILYGIRTYLKGVEQEKILDRKEEFENKKNQT